MLDSPSRSAEAVAIGAAQSALPLRFEDVGYRSGSTPVLTGIGLDLHPGGPTVLLGPNGSGKTTLLKLALGLLAPSSGSISYAGSRRPPPGSLAMLFQKPVMLRRTAAANVAYALKTAGRPTSRDEILGLLELADIGALADRPARRLSGGEQQRLALARALARAPQLLLLDEPTASLDPAATKLVEEVIARAAAAGVKVAMATHDLGQARRLARDVVFLVRGRIVERTPAERFFNDPQSDEAHRFLAGDLVI
jgi:tungstate transport system ATP-binding protein